jgi:hypothetical protein
MNVEFGTEATQFLFWEFIKETFRCSVMGLPCTVYYSCRYDSLYVNVSIILWVFSNIYFYLQFLINYSFV